MNLMSAAFTGKERNMQSDKKSPKTAMFTEDMFDQFLKEHPTPKRTLADAQVKETKSNFLKVRTIANDETMEQELNTLPALVD
jgi:hypothetical protein